MAMDITVGFIGTGNMGGALAKAAANAVPCGNIYLFDQLIEKAKSLSEQLGCSCATLSQVAQCDYIFLGVKPQGMQQLFAELSPLLKERKNEFVLISMAAGVEMKRIVQLAGMDCPVIRIMPNMPVSVGCGMIEYDMTANVTAAQQETFRGILQHAGVLDHLPEQLIDAGTSVAGCGPAFAFLFIDALTQGGIACGLTAQQAQLYATQMLLGSAKLAMESQLQPKELAQAVCSPGGSTIEGVHALQDRDFAQTVISAVEASFRRNQELGK